MLRHITAVWTEELENNLESKDGLEAILAALDAHRDHLLHFPHHARAMYILWSASFDPASEFKPNIVEFHRLQRATAAAWVLNGQKSGDNRADVNPDSLAEQFYASLLGLNFQWLVNPEIDLTASFDVLKQNIIALMRSPSDLT